VARYAGAIYDNAATFEHDFPAGVGNVVGVPDAAFVTSALADSELAALVAERDELQAEVERLRGQSLPIIRTLTRRAREAEAKVNRLRVLANSDRMPWAIALMDGSTVADHLRAALADPPAEQRAEGGA
jgi:hypothetical protein